MFSVSVHNLKMINSFCEAKLWWERMHPSTVRYDRRRRTGYDWLGTKCVPLGNLQSSQYKLRKLDDSTYQLELYDTACVVYRMRNGVEQCIIDASYDSRTTRSFVWRMTPSSISHRWALHYPVGLIDGRVYDACQIVFERQPGTYSWTPVPEMMHLQAVLVPVMHRDHCTDHELARWLRRVRKTRRVWERSGVPITAMLKLVRDRAVDPETPEHVRRFLKYAPLELGSHNPSRVADVSSLCTSVDSDDIAVAFALNNATISNALRSLHCVKLVDNIAPNLLKRTMRHTDV